MKMAVPAMKGGMNGQTKRARCNGIVDTVSNKDDLVLVALGEHFATSKWPAFKPKLHGPGTVVDETHHHPRYQLLSFTGMRTRNTI